MKKYFGMILIIIGAGCAQRNEKVQKESENKINLITTVETPYKNPVLIYGSSFGQFFQQLFKLGKFDEMLKFTSKQTIEKYSRDTLTKMYSKLDFAFPLKLKNMSDINEKGIKQMTYETSIYATVKVFRMNVTIENDSVKLVSCDLKGFPE